MFKQIINLSHTYKFTVCHRMPERSFFFRGKQFPFCSRCTGIIVGYWLYPFFIFDIISLPLMLLVCLHFPLFLDGITQTIYKRESTNYLRFITGFLAGISQVGLMDFLATYIAKFLYQIL